MSPGAAVVLSLNHMPQERQSPVLYRTAAPAPKQPATKARNALAVREMPPQHKSFRWSSAGPGRLQPGFKFSHTRAQRLVPLPARGHILNAGGCAQDLSIGSLEQRDVELDRNSPAVLGEGGNGKH